ncbi:MOR1A protein, partial [Vidua chalybeata]|nr:MOR1A protein [Vidua chalybeata]
VGNSSVLTCPLKGNMTLLKWTITPKAGGPCTLVYRVDTNVTHRTNCSDNINWTFRAGLPPALEIRQVGIAQEGNYSCEMATTEGNFHKMYHLTVLVLLSCVLDPCCWQWDGMGWDGMGWDGMGWDLCEAAVGKPPAQLSWLPGGSSTAEEKCHDNRTVTVLSKFTACSTNVTNVTTCMVSHPAGNWSQSIAC